MGVADYWKSQPKKFCQYCKCWIADNKPSVEFHERGKNHKENVAAKISEIKQRSLEKAKQEDKQSKEFAAMEKAALKAYAEDLKRMGIEPDSPDPSPVQAPTPARVQSPSQTKPKPPPRREHKKKPKGRAWTEPRKAEEWVEGRTEDGLKYYYNSVTGDSRWDQPDGFEGGSSTCAQAAVSQVSSGSVWVEAVSPDGYTYYYHSETGESSWERPAGFPAEGGSRSGSGASADPESLEKDPSSPQADPVPGEEDSCSNGGQGAMDGGPEGQDSQLSKDPKSSFRKKKDGQIESSEKEEKDKASSEDDKKEEKGDQGTKGGPVLPEEVANKKKEEGPLVKRSRQATAYGAWEQIQEEQDPYEKVDLQLPQVEGGVIYPAPGELPPEPKPKFKERTITSLGDGGGPASFRKRKAQNGSARSLRKREEDD
ncbi:WW domain-binding protein 4 [Aplochiton taeniatus]